MKRQLADMIGERSSVSTPNQPAALSEATSFDRGFLLGILVGEGHFGGDGKQPQLTLKLHVRHEALLRRVMTICPGGRLYGPYHHGDRHYFQLMYRGMALCETMIPLLDSLPWVEIDPTSFERYSTMKTRYARFLESAAKRNGEEGG